jgi:prefoldin alpha subunit
MSTSGRPAPATEEQLQEELLRLDAYRGQLSAMVDQHQYLQASRAEHQRAKESLEGLEKTGGTAELLIPLGGETFVRGSPSSATRVLIGLGSGIVVEVERPQAVETLAQRITRIEEAGRELEGQIHTLDERIQLLSRRLESATQRGADGAGEPGDVGGD